MNRKHVSVVVVVFSIVLISVGCATHSDMGGSFSTGYSSSLSQVGGANLDRRDYSSPGIHQQAVISTHLQFDPSTPLALVIEPHFPID